MVCEKCGCEGRVARVEEEDSGAWVQYVCGNQGCGNYRCIIGDAWVEKDIT